MKFEQFHPKQEIEKKEEDIVHGKTPERFMFFLKKFIDLYSSNFKVKGEENLQKIPKDKKLLIVTSHISDIDMPIATYALVKEFNIFLTNQSSQHTFSGDPAMNSIMRLVGKDNFAPIDYRQDGSLKRSAFNPNNFIDINEGKAKEKGNRIPMVAAHNPARGELPKGGYGAVFLAQIMDATILPVAVDLKSDSATEPMGMADNQITTLKAKPEMEVTIGEPIFLDQIGGLKEALKDRDEKENKERLNIHPFKEDLKRQSDEIMKKIASLLPEEKRGAYK